jgi:Carbohydrate family 9 binding domain-like
VRRALLGVMLVAASWLPACGKKPAPPELSGLVLALPPGNIPIKLDVDFGGAVQLLGATVSPMRDLKPGSRVELTLYWKKTGPVAEGFRLFTHVLDEAGERVLNLDGSGPLRKTLRGTPLLPPSAWEVGKTYVDKQTFTVPTTLRTDTMSIVCGLYRDEERLRISRGKHQAERALVAVLPIARPVRASGSVPVLWVPRRQKDWALDIDGKLDDASWARAATTGQLMNAGTGEPQVGANVTGSVRLIHDDEALYLAFEVYDENVRGGFDEAVPDPHLWLRDTVEVMIDPDGDGDNKDYYEIQVGPQNLVFDSRFDDYNQPRVEPNGPYGHQDWTSNVKSAVALHGTLDDDREDDGYTVEMAIPWSSLARAKRTPPTSADTWRMNFYVMENNAGAAWSHILGQGNFHRASRFGRVHFAGRTSRAH